MKGTVGPQPDQVEHAQEQRKLQELHQLYLRFMTRLGRERGTEYPWLTEFDDFMRWWCGLDPLIRQVCERDFFKGFEEVVAEGEREVADVIARYDR
jgi:hypothetical protein